MLTDPLSEALAEATREQPFVPDVNVAVHRGRRMRARRTRVTVAGALLVAAAIGAGVAVAIPGSSQQRATISPAPIPSAPPPSPATSPGVGTVTAPPATTPPPASPRTPADPAVVQQVTTLAPSLFAAVPAAMSTGGPTKVSGPALTVGGKPVVFWAGAEYSPFSAAERWPLIVALSRFGTWSSLSTLTSASEDLPPDIASFSFYGARYTSPYLRFQSVELNTNRQVGTGYEKLQAPTAEQQELLNQYDSLKGAIPFIDFGNQNVLIGATYDDAVLAGKTPAQIAAALADPATDISKSIIGSANVMTAAICTMTGGQPGSVCSSPPVSALVRG